MRKRKKKKLSKGIEKQEIGGNDRGKRLRKIWGKEREKKE